MSTKAKSLSSSRNGCNISKAGRKFLGDETKKIFLSTKGKNRDEVPKELIHFLEYMENSTDAYVATVTDASISELHEKVRKLKKERNLEARYMTFEELLKSREKDGIAKGKVESILELLEDYGSVSEELSIEEFTQKM